MTRSLDLVGIYANLDKKVNLIGPYILIGCFIDPEYTEPIINLLNSQKTPIQIVRAINKLKLPEEKLLIYPFILNSYFIDQWGVELAVTKATRQIESAILFKFYNQSQFSKKPFFIFQSSRLLSIEGLESVYVPNSIEHPALSIARIYTETFRNYYLSFYFRKYPALWINTHKGRASPSHFKVLKRQCLLPEFYIKHLTAEFYLDQLGKSKSAQLPHWLELWLERYLTYLI